MKNEQIINERKRLKMTQTRTSFVFYESFYEALKDLPTDEQLKAFHSICRYALYGEEPEVDGLAKAIFILVKPQLDANNRRYENGKKGGRPPKTETNTEPNGNLTETKQEPNINQTQTKPNPNVNVNVNANVNENDNANNSSTTKVVATAPSKRTTRKEQLVNYVNELDYSEETKKALFSWIFQIGLNGNVTVQQLKDKLEYIWNIYDEESLVRQSIEEAYRNNWFGFFPLKNTSTKSPATMEKKEPSSLVKRAQDNMVSQVKEPGTQAKINKNLVW